jgi:hypothetical protein
MIIQYEWLIDNLNLYIILSRRVFLARLSDSSK